jgi:hypothetical protein
MGNLDLLEWFAEGERDACPECGKLARVGVEDAPMFRVCLDCAAVWVEGKRVDNALHQLHLADSPS